MENLRLRTLDLELQEISSTEMGQIVGGTEIIDKILFITAGVAGLATGGFMTGVGVLVSAIIPGVAIVGIPLITVGVFTTGISLSIVAVAASS